MVTLFYILCLLSVLFLEEKGIDASAPSTHIVHTHTAHATARQALFLVSAALSQLRLGLYSSSIMCLLMIKIVCVLDCLCSWPFCLIFVILNPNLGTCCAIHKPVKPKCNSKRIAVQTGKHNWYWCCLGAEVIRFILTGPSNQIEWGICWYIVLRQHCFCFGDCRLLLWGWRWNGFSTVYSVVVWRQITWQERWKHVLSFHKPEYSCFKPGCACYSTCLLCWLKERRYFWWSPNTGNSCCSKISH